MIAIPCHRSCPYRSAFHQCHHDTFLKSAFFPPPLQLLDAFATCQVFCQQLQHRVGYSRQHICVMFVTDLCNNVACMHIDLCHHTTLLYMV